MRKGFQWSVSMLIAVVLLIFSIAVFWNYIAGSNTNLNSNPDVTLQKEFCDTDADCVGNPQGKKCLQIYPGGCENVVNQTCYTPFCGCISNADCNDFICGTDNKCTKQTVIS